MHWTLAPSAPTCPTLSPSPQEPHPHTPVLRYVTGNWKNFGDQSLGYRQRANTDRVLARFTYVIPFNHHINSERETMIFFFCFTKRRTKLQSIFLRKITQLENGRPGFECRILSLESTLLTTVLQAISGWGANEGKGVGQT